MAKPIDNESPTRVVIYGPDPSIPSSDPGDVSRTNPLPVYGVLTDVLQGGTTAYPPELIANRSRLLFGDKIAKTQRLMGRRSKGWFPPGATDILSDVANYLDGTQPRINDVSTATAYFLRSTSASDGVAGIGVRTMRVVYLDTAGNEQNVTLPMNGTTGVALPLGISYFQWMEADSVGSNTAAVGTISIASIAGAPTVAQTVEQMSPGSTRSFSARYKVPTGYTAYFIVWKSSMQGGADMDVRLQAQTFSDTHAASVPFIPKAVAFVTNNAPDQMHVLSYIPIREGCQVKVNCFPGGVAASNRVDSTAVFLLVEN